MERSFRRLAIVDDPIPVRTVAPVVANNHAPLYGSDHNEAIERGLHRRAGAADLFGHLDLAAPAPSVLAAGMPPENAENLQIPPLKSLICDQPAGNN
ncbi:hypothetical protein ASE71_19795 [Ensifer sp. Root954]|nr:hypothetical protein ASE71_19795 [Ensifer sp. Root954]